MWRKLEHLNCPELHTYTKKCRVKTSSIETIMDVTARNKRMWQKSHHTKPHHSVMDVTEIGAFQLHWATLTLTMDIGTKLGVLKLSGMCQTINVCHICDLLNHHGCDRVSATDMTEIRGGKLHWATLKLTMDIGIKLGVMKLSGMWVNQVKGESCISLQSSFNQSAAAHQQNWAWEIQMNWTNFTKILGF